MNIMYQFIKKKSLIFSFALCFGFGTGHISAQTPDNAAEKPVFKNVMGAGVGFGGTIYSGYGNFSGLKQNPTISLFYEHFVKDNFWNGKGALGLGATLGYSSATWEGDCGYGFEVGNTFFGARGALHYAPANRFDIYLGGVLCYNVVSWKWTGNVNGLGDTDVSNGLAWGGFAGLSIYVLNAVAIFAEAGYGVATVNFGVNVRF